MPIKIPKGFPRRKSSGNALEELPNPPEPSFRVFERPAAKSFDGGNTLKHMSNGRPLSAGHFRGEQLYVDGSINTNPNNRGSGGTNNSASSGGHDTSGSSARFSSSSTLPSSTDLPLDDRPSPNAKDPYDMPAPPIPESTGYSIRAAGKTFSFGRKKAESSSTPAPRPNVAHAQSDGYTNLSRERAMTESSYASESTATPPKLLDTGLDLGQSDLDSFGDMFENFGKRRSQIQPERPGLGLRDIENPESTSPTGVRMLTQSYSGEFSTPTPPSKNLDRPNQLEASPRSVGSHDSRDGLISSPISNSPAMERTFSYEEDPTVPRPGQGLPKSRTMPIPGPVSPSHQKRQQRPPSGAGEGLRRNSVYASPRNSGKESALLLDQDARLVMDSISASRRLDRKSGGEYQDSDDEDNPAAALVPEPAYPPGTYKVSGPQRAKNPAHQQLSPASDFDSSDRDFSSTPWRQESADSTPKARKSGLVRHEERSMFDVSPPPSARKAVPPPQPPSKPNTQNKVMTPAQFERYRRELEMTRTGSRRSANDASDEDGDDYEDDDEIERNKVLARQRRKQEAHLAVYRQQMMKMTGEQPSDLPNMELRPGMESSSMSTPNLQHRSSTPSFSFDKPPDAGKASDDEDEDVPLGVLAAHGFPSKTRLPTAMSNAGSHVQYKSESYPPPPASTSGASGAGRASGLPAFARRLPPDPYYGAGLVNSANRESLAFGQGGPGSAYGGSQPNVQPGGLVGVIAGEERARAARRGSPNASGTYGSPLPPSMSQLQMGALPGLPPMMTPGEQATVQMSEQMNQMMQMQMQWMQQMQQMMASGMQPGQPMLAMPPPPQQQMMMNPGMLAPPGQAQRPMSSNAHGSPAGPQQGPPRARSMMSLGPSPPWPPQMDIRKSVAPSMASGALGGPGPGYTPSIAPSERSNVGMASRYRPVSIAPAPADDHAPRASSRASTFTSDRLQPGDFGRDSRSSMSGDRQSKMSLQPISSTPPRKAASDDDDEEGWEEMKKKRDKKKSIWRLNKKKDEHAGLDVYDYPDA